MIVVGIDPGLSGAIAILENNKVLNIFDMPVMAEGKKNKRQLNSAQLVSIIKDQKIKAYSKIEAVKTLFQIIDKGVIDRQQAEQLNELKEMVNALEGNNKVIEVN